MKNLKLSYILIIALTLLSSCQCYGSNLKTTYMQELKAISKIKGNGSNELFTLIRATSSELEKDWSKELAQELARVFNELLNVNENYFLVELIGPVVQKRSKEFIPILNKALSKKNSKLYKEMLEMDKNEEKHGNG